MKKKTISEADKAHALRMLSYSRATGQFVWVEKPAKQISIGQIAGTKTKQGYVQIKLLNAHVFAHRLAFLFETGEIPDLPIDHINGDREDNSWLNLRIATDSVNAQNLRNAKSSNKSTGLLGAYFHKRAGRWMSSIRVDGKNKYLGLFDSPESAHQAYLSEKRKSHAGCTI